MSAKQFSMPHQRPATAAPEFSRRALRSCQSGLALMALASCTSLIVAGCRDHGLDGPTAAALHDASRRHPIHFANRTEALYVEVASDGLGLSDNQSTDVARFLDRYKSEAQGPLRIAAPASVKGHIAVSKSFRDIEEIVDRSGLPVEAVERQRSKAVDKFGPAVKLSYERPTAVAPHCGNWPDNLGEVEREKLPYENFGCASQRNLALTVANARDLQLPQEETPRSSERRSASWSKYAGSPSGAGGPSGGGGAAPSSAAPSAPKAQQ